MKKLFGLLLLSFLPMVVPAAAQNNSARMISGVNPQTGTSYLFVPIDVTRITTFNNASPITATLPPGTTAGFGNGAIFSAKNLGLGSVTIACTGCLIFASGAGSVSFTISQGQGVDLYSDGLNYIAQSGGGSAAGTGCVANPADAGCGISGNPSVDLFVPSVGAGTGWLVQLLINGFNVRVPVNVIGSTAGVFSMGCGPDPGVGSGIALTGPSSCSPYTIYFPSNSASGFWRGSNTANKLTMTFQNQIDAANDIAGVLPLANGGCGNSTASGCLVNLFPNFTRNGDLCCFWNGSAWVSLAGNSSAAGTVGFATENSGGSWTFTVSPLGTPVGGTGLNTKIVSRVYAGAGTGPEAITSIFDDNTGTTFLVGVKGDGAGFKHKRVTGCTTGATSGNTCSTTVTWTTAFADANYTPVCTLLGPATLGHLAAISTDVIAAASVKVETVTDTNAAITGTINCIAIHD